MKRLFTTRSVLSLVFLLVMGSALVSGVKESVREVQEAVFFPVVALPIILCYVLGFSTWSARRVLPIVLIIGLGIAFIESARLAEPIKNILRTVPQFELELVRWALQKELPKEFPDISVFQIQFNEAAKIAGAFVSRVWSASVKQSSVREFFWDIPLLMLAAWAGWGTGRHNQPFLALAPMIGLHAFILNYTGKDTISLQVAIFSLVFITGINQKWNLAHETTGSSERAVRETYPAIILLAIMLAITAGLAPPISIKDIAQKLTARDKLAEAIGLEKEIAKIYGISGLPRSHLIGLSPKISNTVIFTVKTGELAPTENIIIKEIVPRHYWRWLVYDVYNGHGWSTSPTTDNSYSANQLLLPIADQQYQVVHQQVTKSFTQDNRLYWTGSLVKADQPYTANWRTSPETRIPDLDPHLSADMLGATIKEKTYQADSIIPIISADELRASPRTYPDEISERYLSLPENIPQRVIDLARELTAKADNPYDKAKAIEAYLRTYPYSLDIAPPPPDREISDYFLFDLKIGYCDYYATSMIVLARAAALPARLVIGYTSGIYDSAQAEYIVREANAHSWVEVYFAGIGWVEFEPTASQSSIYLPDESPQKETSTLTTFPFLPEHHDRVKAGHFRQKNYTPLIIGSAAIPVILVVWFLISQGLLRAHRSIGSIYGYVYYHGRKIYKDAPLYETPSIFADKLQKRLRTGYRWLSPAPDEIRLLTDLYLQETYSAHPIEKDERILAVRVWRKLFWRLIYVRLLRL